MVWSGLEINSKIRTLCLPRPLYLRLQLLHLSLMYCIHDKWIAKQEWGIKSYICMYTCFETFNCMYCFTHTHQVGVQSTSKEGIGTCYASCKCRDPLSTISLPVGTTFGESVEIYMALLKSRAQMWCESRPHVEVYHGGSLQTLLPSIIRKPFLRGKSV